MSSVIFQPLLHDPLGWKPLPTTYADHYQWKKHRLTRKDKIVSPYGQKYQRQLQREKEQQQQEKTQLQEGMLNYRSTPSLVVPKPQEEPVTARVPSVKKIEDDKRSSRSSKSSRKGSSKSLRVPTEESPATYAEPVAPSRAGSVQRELTNVSRVSQRSTHTPVATEEIPRPVTRLEHRSIQRDETSKSVIDPDNDDSRHWLTYPNPKTPQHIIESKVRLGQMKAPAILARAKSALYASTEETRRKTPQLLERTESASMPDPLAKSKSPDQRHFLDFNLPDTPDELRAARHRIDRHRYNPSLDDYPPRPQTCPDRIPEPIFKPPTPALPPAPAEPSAEPTSSTNEPSSNENEENPTSEQEIPTVMVQPINTDGLPTEYVDALETANLVHDEYMKLMKQNAEKKTEPLVYRLSAMSNETKQQVSSAHRQQQQQQPSTSAPPNPALRQQDFGTWVRQATDQERYSAMKILHDVLNKPVNDGDLVPSSATPTAPRSRSSTRKLGRVRTQPRFLPDSTEQNYVQNDLWNITRSDGLINTHPVPGSKSTVIHV